MAYGNLTALFAAANAVEGTSVNQGSLLYRQNEVDAYMAVLWSALYASDESELRYPTDTIRRDAFRHGYWSSLLTDSIGATYAEIATTTYEDETPDNDGISRDMDIFNNGVGRSLAEGQYFDTYEQCGDMIDEAIDQGEFKIIYNGVLVTSMEGDRYETTAQLIYDDEDVLGRVDSVNDVDYYKISFADNGEVNFYLNPLDPSLDVDLSIYDEAGDLLESSQKGTGQFELITLSVSANTMYYIKILHYGSSLPDGNNYHFRCKNYPIEGVSIIGNQIMYLNLQKDSPDTGKVTINTTKMYIPNDEDGKQYRYFHEQYSSSELISTTNFEQLIQLKEKLFKTTSSKLTAYFGEYYIPSTSRADIENNIGYFKGLHEGFDMVGPADCKFYAFGDGEVIYHGPSTTYNLIVVKYDNLDPSYRVAYAHASSLNTELYIGAHVDANTWLGYQGKKGLDSTAGEHVHWEIRNSGSDSSIAPSLSDSIVSNPNPHALLSSLLNA